MTALSEIVPGTFISDRYRIENLLGQGGFGRTYLVSDLESLSALCVLKEFFPLRTEEAVLEKSLELFQREAKVLQRLTHPQIPRFLDWFEERGRVCIILEYIDGKTYWDLLRERLTEGRPAFSEAEVIQWLKDILPVLDYLHSCYVIHRDISPDNIMLCKQTGKPILIDLGIVKEAATHGYYSYVSSGGTLGSVSLVGKRGYSPPEQMLMGQCYPSSDLYALAVTALVLLTGRPPTELYNSHSMEWQWKNYVELSEDLAEIFSRMLREKPKERYQSAQEILAVLPERTLEDELELIIELDVASDEPTILFDSKATPEEELNPPQDKVVIVAEDKIAAPSKSRKSLKIGGIIAAGMLLVGSVVVGIQSPFISALCKTLDNCAKDKQYLALYLEHVEGADAAIAASIQAKTVAELTNARDRLNQTIAQLQVIPNDVKIFSQSQQTLKNYQASFQQLDTKIAKEQQAEQQLKQAETLIAQAIKTTEAAQTITQHQQAKTEWDKVQTHLTTIPTDVIVATQVKTHLENSKSKAQEIQTKIEQQVQEAQRRQQAAQPRTVPSRSRTVSPSSTATPSARTTTSSTQPRRTVSRSQTSSTTRRSQVPVRPSTSRNLWGNSPKQSSPSSSSESGQKKLW
jgi:serine/threonine-protein kinase